MGLPFRRSENLAGPLETLSLSFLNRKRRGLFPMTSELLPVGNAMMTSGSGSQGKGRGRGGKCRGLETESWGKTAFGGSEGSRREGGGRTSRRASVTWVRRKVPERAWRAGSPALSGPCSTGGVWASWATPIPGDSRRAVLQGAGSRSALSRSKGRGRQGPRGEGSV